MSESPEKTKDGRHTIRLPSFIFKLFAPMSPKQLLHIANSTLGIHPYRSNLCRSCATLIEDDHEHKALENIKAVEIVAIALVHIQRGRFLFAQHLRDLTSGREARRKQRQQDHGRQPR